MSNAVTARDVVNEVARRQSASTTDVTHRALMQRFATSTDGLETGAFDELIDSMVPALLTCRHADSTYDLTAEGWLESDFRTVVEQIVEAYVRSYRGAAPDVVGRLTITGKDLAANGAADANAGLVWAVGRAFYLYKAGAFQKELARLSFQAPVDVDELMRLKSCAEVRDHRLSRPRERVEFVNAARQSITRDVRAVRDAVWSAFKTRNEWPKTKELDVELSSKGLVVERIVESDVFVAGVTVSLSLRGLWLTPGTDVEQDRVMRVLGALCDVYVQQQDATSVRAAELRRVRADVSEDDARWVWRFLRHNMQFHVGTDVEASAFVLVPDLVAFRGASSFEDALFNLSRRGKPSVARGRDMQLIPGLPFDSLDDEGGAPDFGAQGTSTTSASNSVADSLSTSSAEIAAGTEFRLPRMDVSYGEKLGSGAFGTVWQATDQLLDREIAVKFLTSTNEYMDEVALLREARSLAKVSHPNLVVVHGAAWLRHPLTGLVQPAIMMELLKGEVLLKWRERQHERDEVLRVVIGILLGVQAMHNAGLHHSDLHPKNVIVTTTGDPKLIDWRYQDTFLERPTEHRIELIEEEQRRTIDAVVTLLEKQGLHEESLRIRGQSLISDVLGLLEQLQHAEEGVAARRPKLADVLLDVLTKKGGGGYNLVKLAVELGVKPSEVRPLVEELFTAGDIELLTLNDDDVVYRLPPRT